MQRMLSPNYTSTPQSYANSTIECLERCDLAEDSNTLISGAVFANGKQAWLARGSSLEVVNTKTGERTAAWRFGWSSKQKRAVTITSVVAFPNRRTHCLVVGLKDLSGSLPGMVCLFDPSVARVIKAVVIPYPVTSLECVSTFGGADAPTSLLSGQLKLFFGVIAVGTEQGHMYLVDMRLDDDLEKFDEWDSSIITTFNCHTDNVSMCRENARANDTHVAIELGDEFHKSGQFYFDKQDSRNERIYSSGDVFVSALKYVPQAGCLVIGYNFGCFIIWDLSSMAIVYTSQVDQYDMSAITHLSYQEPENDPRNCSYLWVARGPLTLEDESLEIPTTLTLYQLIFASRELLPGYGIVYKDLSGCGRRFEHQLTADAHHLADATSVGSRVISCYTIEIENVSHDMSKVDEGSTRELTIMFCVWEAPSHDPLASPTCHLGIFDINRWYHSQMQPSLRDAMFGSKDSTCPFFAFFSLADILDVASPDGIIAVYINSRSVARFKSNSDPPLEQHYWPASLKFDACFVMETGIVHSKFLGMQRQILASLQQQGVSTLSEAHSFFNMCWAAGLLPRNFDMSHSQDKNFHLEAILSVCLEHGLVEFITSCIYNSGAQISPCGFSLRLILDWSWTRVVNLKEQLDQLSVPLFDGGGGRPDDHMLLLLDHMAIQMSHLKSIFQALLNQSESSSQQGLKDLSEKSNVVFILSKYIKLILWFIKHGILPDQSVDEEVSFLQREFVYSNASFKTYYNKRQSEMHALGGDVIVIGLMIDKIVAQFDGLWLSSVGKEQYPPSSLHALCGLYLLDKISPDMKHSVIYYFLLDICSIHSDFNDQNIADQFAQAFYMPENLTKLIKAFWFLDHKEFKNGIKLLVDELVQTKEIGPWQNNYIIKTLLLQGEFQKALQFVKTVCPTMHTIDDVRLQLSVLLTNGLVTEAFNFQRQHRNPSINTDLLMHFFNGCQQNGNISRVMELPLNSLEEENFIDFLQCGNFEASKELLVMYYLQRGRYVEGIRLNEAIKQDIVNESIAKVSERSKVRNAIVDGYIKCLPSIQRKLIFIPGTRHSKGTVKEVPRPKPLSTVLHHVKHGRPISHASLLNSVMEKVGEARPQSTPQRRRSGPFVGTPHTPSIKGLLNDSQRMVFANEKKPEMEPEESIRSSQQAVTTPPTLLDKKRRKQLYSGADALTLLTTPKIIKRPSKHGIVNESITVSTTPQSILKVSRVVRRSTSPRTSPTTSPTTSPPLLRRDLLDKSKQTRAKNQGKDSVDVGPEPAATPSRRIRFATEDPSPTSEHAPTTIDQDKPVDVMDITANTSPKVIKGVSFTDNVQETTEDSLRLELSTSTDEKEGDGEAEVQITAAVLDLRGSSDLEEEVIGQEEEDYSSYELDESDNPIAEDSEDEVMTRRNSFHSSNVVKPDQKDAVKLDSEDPLMRSSPQTPACTPSEDHSMKPLKVSTHKTPSPGKQPSTKTQLATLEMRTDITMTPPKSPLTTSIISNSTKTQSPATLEVNHYAFSPPAILRTAGITLPPEHASSSSATDEFLFSPPLTRSMIKRRSLEVSKSLPKTTEVSITGRSLRRRSYAEQYEPHQSPTDSPISFISPAPNKLKSPKGSRPRSAKKPIPKHKMTLRSRLTLRSAKLPHKS